jgi:tRNA wybutosine-synthesizing protein 1
MIPTNLASILKKQKYRIVGKHSGVKICLWTRKSLKEGKVCYKEKWYGIESHRCMEFSPALIWCPHHCLFCWRVQSGDRKIKWKEFPFDSEIDEPKEIIDEAIKARKELLSGFGSYVDSKKLKEALIPSSIAISLAGEPTLYPKLSELIEECHRRRMKTFLVTNGTMPKILENLNPLTLHIYITLPSQNK